MLKYASLDEQLLEVLDLEAFALPDSSRASLPTESRSTASPLCRQPPFLFPASAPVFLFLAVPGASAGEGRVDAIGTDTLQRADTSSFQAGIQSIPVPGVSGLMSYFRQ